MHWRLIKKTNILYSLLIVILLACSKGNSLKASFPKIKWIDSLKNQKTSIDKDFQEKNIPGMKIRLEGEFGNNLLITEVISDVDADRAFKLFSNKVMMIRGLYSVQENTDGNCPKGLEINPTPLENKIQTSIRFNLKATERLVLGVCGEEQNIYRIQTLMLYCKNQKTFYDLRYYYPKSQKLIELPIASCVD